MEKLKENLEENLNVEKEKITDNGDGSITFLLDETKVTVDENGKVELGESVPVIKATKIEVENLIIEEGIKTGKLNVTTTPSEITENLIYTSKNTKVITVDNEGNVTVKGEGEAQVEVKGEKSGVKGECTVTVQFGLGVKVTGENKTYTNNGQAVIPVGFCIVPGCNNISEGLVISDNDEDTEVDKNNLVAKGNQFVWIPVEKEEDYKINEEYLFGISLENIKNDTGYLPIDDTEMGIDERTDEKDKEKLTFAKEKELVTKENVKGFYISRYEAGKEVKEEKNQLVSKKEANVWCNIEKETSKEIAKTFIVNNKNVKSGLATGIQWDMVMNFINNKKDGNNQDYIVTVASPLRHTEEKDTSGKNIADKVCNIYDLEGNCYEYVAENNDDTSNPFILRGGYCGFVSPAAPRTSCNGGMAWHVSFRFVLYVM